MRLTVGLLGLPVLLTAACVVGGPAPAPTVTVTATPAASVPAPAAVPGGPTPAGQAAAAAAPVRSNADWNALPHPGQDCSGAGYNDATETNSVQSNGELTFVDRDCLHSVSSPPEIVYAYNGTGSNPHLVGTLLSESDDAHDVRLSFAGATITVVGAVASPGEAHCCPTSRLTRTYTYAAGTLTYISGSVDGAATAAQPVYRPVVVGDGRGLYCVSGVAADDTLYVHPTPGAATATTGHLSPYDCEVQDLGRTAHVGGGLWVDIASGVTSGWVNSAYLTFSRTR